MNYKTCMIISENFVLDEKFNVNLAIRDDSDSVIKKIPVSNPLEKGYIYTALYFYDEFQKEIGKLLKIIRTAREEAEMDIKIEDPTVLFLEISKRVSDKIGEDSLDALIKEELLVEMRSMGLVVEPAERKKLEIIKEAIFGDIMLEFIDKTLGSAADSASELGKKTFKMTEKYISSMTDTQKKLFAATVKMVGYLTRRRLNGFELLPDWSVRYSPEFLDESFDEQEEEIKNSLKKLMEDNFS